MRNVFIMILSPFLLMALDWFCTWWLHILSNVLIVWYLVVLFFLTDSAEPLPLPLPLPILSICFGLLESPCWSLKLEKRKKEWNAKKNEWNEMKWWNIRQDMLRTLHVHRPRGRLGCMIWFDFMVHTRLSMRRHVGLDDTWHIIMTVTVLIYPFLFSTFCFCLFVGLCGLWLWTFVFILPFLYSSIFKAGLWIDWWNSSLLPCFLLYSYFKDNGKWDILDTLMEEWWLLWSSTRVFIYRGIVSHDLDWCVCAGWASRHP